MMRSSKHGRIVKSTFSNVTCLAVSFALGSTIFSGQALATISADKQRPNTVKVESPPIKWMVKMGGRVAVELENPTVVCEIGRQLPLFQQTDKSYVAMVPTLDGGHRLCAFPRYTGGDNAAWVSIEHILVFAQRTSSIRGSFVFDENEVVPLVRENSDSYTVEILRNNRRVEMTVSKTTPGVVLVPMQYKPPAKKTKGIPVSAAQATPPPAESAESAEAVVRPPPFVIETTAAIESSPELALAKIREQMLQEILDKLEKAKKDHVFDASAKAIDDQAAKDKPPVASPVLAVPTVAAAATPRPGERVSYPQEPAGIYSLKDVYLLYVRENAASFLLMGIVLLLALELVLRMNVRRAGGHQNQAGHSGGTASASSSEVFTYSTVGESVTPEALQNHLSSHGDLSGTLGGYILPQVVQFFSSAHESGRMTIIETNGHVAELIFRDGQIIDAYAGTASGKLAAQAILQLREGRFNFRRDNVATLTPAIHDDTVSLLLEAHQIFDESQKKSF